MGVLPLVFAVIAATIGVMLGLLFAFRRFFRLREERAPEVVHAAGEAPAPSASPKAARPAPGPEHHHHDMAA